MMELRRYQQEARVAVEQQWQSGISRTLLVLPTGTGKTIVFSKIVEDCVRQGERVLILAHRGELLDQAADKLQKSAGLKSAVEKAEQSCLGTWYRVVVGSVQSLMRAKRLAKFSLEVAEDKTRILPIGRFKGTKEEFDFLGFTFYNTKTRQGK